MVSSFFMVIVALIIAIMIHFGQSTHKHLKYLNIHIFHQVIHIIMPARKNKNNKNKNNKKQSSPYVKPRVGGIPFMVVGEVAHSKNLETKNKSQYLRTVFNDKTAEIEVNSKTQRLVHQRAVSNGTYFKVEFSSKQLKKQSNPSYNVGSIPYIVYDPIITALTPSEERKYKKCMGFNINHVPIDQISEHAEDSKVDLIAKVINDEVKWYGYGNRKWQSRAMKFGDLTGSVSYFTNDKEYTIPDNQMILLKNTLIQKKGIYTNINGGFFVANNILDKYVEKQITELLGSIDDIK
eukprot:410332_1